MAECSDALKEDELDDRMLYTIADEVLSLPECEKLAVTYLGLDRADLLNITDDRSLTPVEMKCR